MTAAHTPGPWQLSDKTSLSPSDVPYFAITAGDPWSEDFQSMGFCLTGIMREPDARLIAAAPEMLAALIAWQDADDGHRRDDSALFAAETLRDAAIAKATVATP